MFEGLFSLEILDLSYNENLNRGSWHLFCSYAATDPVSNREPVDDASV